MRAKFTDYWKVLIIGALIGAFAVVGALVSFDLEGSPASAQSDNTWQVIYVGDWPAQEVTFELFVEQLPAECDLVPSPHDKWVMFYSCPEPFEPVNPLE